MFTPNFYSFNTANQLNFPMSKSLFLNRLFHFNSLKFINGTTLFYSLTHVSTKYATSSQSTYNL